MLAWPDASADQRQEQEANLLRPSVDLTQLLLQPSSIDTRGFKSLLDLVDNTTHDSFDLYYGLFMYNQVGSPVLSV